MYLWHLHGQALDSFSTPSSYDIVCPIHQSPAFISMKTPGPNLYEMIMTVLVCDGRSESVHALLAHVVVVTHCNLQK